MKVLHVIRLLDPAAGGPPVIAASIAAAQAALGTDVSIACHHDPSRTEPTEKMLSAIVGFSRVNRIALAPGGRLDRFLTSRLTSELMPVVEQHDVVHLHGVWDSILLAASKCARRLRKPCFILLNGMLDPWSLAQSKWKKKLALAMGYRSMLNGAAALHLGNRDERELIEPLGLTAPGIVVPNGLFPQTIQSLPAPGTFRTKHPQLGSSNFILFLSRLHYKKGLDYLADSFAIVAKRFPDVKLVVAGPDDGAQDDFNRQIASLGLTDRTIVTGPIYGDTKLAALVDCSVFCLPSRQEGFSMAITEALGCGAPAVISENCHFPEVQEHGAGRVVKLNADDVADACGEVLSNPDKAREMGENGRKLVLRDYTWESIARKLLDAYQGARR